MILKSRQVPLMYTYKRFVICTHGQKCIQYLPACLQFNKNNNDKFIYFLSILFNVYIVIKLNLWPFQIFFLREQTSSPSPPHFLLMLLLTEKIPIIVDEEMKCLLCLKIILCCYVTTRLQEKFIYKGWVKTNKINSSFTLSGLKNTNILILEKIR